VNPTVPLKRIAEFISGPSYIKDMPASMSNAEAITHTSIRLDGTLDFDYTKSVSRDDRIPTLKGNDIVISRSVPYRTALIPPEEKRVLICGSSVFAIRAWNYHPYLLQEYLNLKSVRRVLEGKTEGSVSPHISLSVWREFPVPVMLDQERVQKICDTLVLVRKLEEARKQQQKLLAELVESIVFHELVKGEECLNDLNLGGDK
jgi:restriction endonuclease S subunit